jgi:hypothetical protein
MNSEVTRGLTGKEILIYKPKMMLYSFEFRLGEECIGKLGFPKALGTLAEAEILGKQWTFKRVGFWHPTITIRTPGSPTDSLRIPLSGLWGRMLLMSLPDGRMYELKMTGLWNAKRIWMRQQRSLIEFGKCSGLKKYAVVRLMEEDPETPLLVALGAYCLVMQDWDDGAAVTAAIG